MTTLKDLHSQRAEARAKLQHSVHALQGAQRTEAEELAHVKECEQRLDAARDRDAYDKAAVKLASVKTDHALAAKRTQDKVAEHAYADMEARTAEARVVSEVDRLLAIERTEQMREAIAAIDTARQLAERVRDVVPDELNTPLDVWKARTDVVRLAQFLAATGADSLNTPVNALGAGSAMSGATRAQRRAERRAALISGEEYMPEKVA